MELRQLKQWVTLIENIQSGPVIDSRKSPSPFGEGNPGKCFFWY